MIRKKDWNISGGGRGGGGEEKEEQKKKKIKKKRKNNFAHSLQNSIPQLVARISSDQPLMDKEFEMREGV